MHSHGRCCLDPYSMSLKISFSFIFLSPFFLLVPQTIFPEAVTHNSTSILRSYRSLHDLQFVSDIVCDCAWSICTLPSFFILLDVAVSILGWTPWSTSFSSLITTNVSSFFSPFRYLANLAFLKFQHRTALRVFFFRSINGLSLHIEVSSLSIWREQSYSFSV